MCLLFPIVCLVCTIARYPDGGLIKYLVLYHIVSHCMEAHCILLYGSVLYCIVLYFIVSYRIVSYRIVSYRIVSYHIVSYLFVSYSIVSHHMKAYCIYIIIINHWYITLLPYMHLYPIHWTFKSHYNKMHDMSNIHLKTWKWKMPA